MQKEFVSYHHHLYDANYMENWSNFIELFFLCFQNKNLCTSREHFIVNEFSLERSYTCLTSQVRYCGHNIHPFFSKRNICFWIFDPNSTHKTKTIDNHRSSIKRSKNSLQILRQKKISRSSLKNYYRSMHFYLTVKILIWRPPPYSSYTHTQVHT